MSVAPCHGCSQAAARPSSGGGGERPARAPLAAALVGEQGERQQADRDRREQVAPEVGARPQLAGDEVEVELDLVAADARPTHQCGDGGGGEERKHEREATVVAANQEAARQRHGGGKEREHGDRLPDHVGGHDPQPEPMGQSRQEHPGVHERRRAVVEVVEVGHAHVLAGLAQPGEVLERVGDEEPVAAGDQAALGPYA